jgi:hypothetical protein
MAALLVAAHGALASTASADAWLVVPVVVGASDDAQLAASMAAEPMREALSGSARVIAPGTARERFETRASSPPVAATHTDLDQIARDAQQALYHVAMGLYTDAGQDVARVMSRADRALESLNRETIAARQLLDACLFIVRARLSARKPQAARTQALECRRLVPDIEPDASMHPPDVIGELAAAEAALEMQKPGSLRVTSAPSGCPVFIQGRNLGQTPLELPRLIRGEYRIQVECVPGEYGRVHRVTLGPSRTVVHVDSHFDAAVQTGHGVSLRYAGEAALEKYAPAHAIEIGRAVGAQRVALITPEPGGAGAVRIWALEVDAGKLRAIALVQVDAQGAIPAARDAVAALVQDRSVDFTQSAPTPLEVSEAELVAAPAESLPAPEEQSPVADLEPVRDEGEEAAPGALAWTLAGVGAAAHVTGWVLYGHQLALESDYRRVRGLSDASEARRRLERIDDFELAPPLVAGIGAALATASLPLLLPESPPGAPPTWAWLAGGGGLALAAAGTVLLVRGAGCDDFDRLRRCDDVVTTTHLGAMVITTAVPLLGVPVVYWLRSLGAPSEATDLTLEASPRAFTLHWRGTL